MPASISFISTFDHDGGKSRDNRVELYELMEGVGSTASVRLQGAIVVQLSGTATNIVAITERSSRDPNTNEVNWAPAETTGWSGNLSSGLAPRPYHDPATGFWRVRITTLTGGSCKVSIVGERT
jgi:hypothetical protein